MKTTVTIEKVTDPNTGLITWSLANENWGPIVSGYFEKEVANRFDKAMRICMILKTFSSIDAMLKNHKFDESAIKKSIKENNSYFLENEAA